MNRGLLMIMMGVILLYGCATVEQEEEEQLPLGCEEPKNASWERYCAHYNDPAPTCAGQEDLTESEEAECMQEYREWVELTDHPNRDPYIFPYPWERPSYTGPGFTIIM